jgi:hypothetical protein
MRPPKQIRLAAALSLLRQATKIDTLKHLHGAIEAEIEKSFLEIDEAKKKEDQDLMDIIVDEECDKIEELLGLAFVSAQSFINTVRTRTITLVKICEEDSGVRLKVAPEPLSLGILTTDQPISSTSPYTAVEAIDAVANYWKHFEEWQTIEKKHGRRLVTIWNAKSKRAVQRRTIEIVTRLGLTAGSTGNLRHAAAALGATRYENLSPIRLILQKWAAALYKKTAAEVTTISQSY